MSPINIVWFKRDLRLQDHEPLLRAALAEEAVDSKETSYGGPNVKKRHSCRKKKAHPKSAC
jgi:deoxyribodipyrimidine photolyase